MTERPLAERLWHEEFARLGGDFPELEHITDHELKTLARVARATLENVGRRVVVTVGGQADLVQEDEDRVPLVRADAEAGSVAAFDFPPASYWDIPAPGAAPLNAGPPGYRIDGSEAAVIGMVRARAKLPMSAFG